MDEDTFLGNMKLASPLSFRVSPERNSNLKKVSLNFSVRPDAPIVPRNCIQEKTPFSKIKIELKSINYTHG